MMIIFLPKENLYYLILNNLKTLKVDVAQSKINDNFLALDILGTQIIYENINIAQIDKLSISTYILNSSIILNNIKVDNSLNKFLPNKLDTIAIRYSLFDPLKVKIKSIFKQGDCVGYIDLPKQTIKLDIHLSKFFVKKYKNITKMLKKDGDVYKYEYKY